MDFKLLQQNSNREVKRTLTPKGNLLWCKLIFLFEANNSTAVNAKTFLPVIAVAICTLRILTIKEQSLHIAFITAEMSHQNHLQCSCNQVVLFVFVCLI